MAENWELRQGDTVGLEANLYRGKKYLAIEGAIITWRMRLQGSVGAYLEGTVNILDIPTALVEYTPTEQDTAVPGLYEGTFRAVFGNGRKATIPTKGVVTLLINPL